VNATALVVLGITQRGGSVGWAAGAACLVATALSGLRWLRVAQREHYLADSSSRFALRWWTTRPVNQLGALIALAGLVVASKWPAAAFATAAVVALGPLGLGVKGRTSPLRWTRRLKTLAAVWVVLRVAIVLAGVLSGFAASICAAGAVVVPALVDMACVITGPLETRLAEGYVRRASERLRRVQPKVVAITGSFGKTSTKGYVAHLLSGSMAVVASPASFNNRAGLARAVNEHLAQGTDVFVAEMGTYGRGEIAALCSWMRPDVAVITAIGPVHLERFGSEDEIVLAKSEILADAPCCVIVIDDPRLASLAEDARARGKRVWRVSTSVDRADAEVVVAGDADGWRVAAGEKLVAAGVATSAQAANVGCAVAVALELGVAQSEIARLLGSLPVAAHRLERREARSGFVVLDDTYNSNPAGARSALAALSQFAEDGKRRVVVTPGMVELGARQASENAAFAREVAGEATDLVVVGRTNRRALVAGFTRARSNSASLLEFNRRKQAASWVREHLGPGDVVLYENDLPDHYP
jgi:UDP-N-acetylmuramoyl-tripeptide--D-alanyl-D-alanine ligase